jgi:glycosyltransferase involved in cell wall biosynthesis
VADNAAPKVQRALREDVDTPQTVAAALASFRERYGDLQLPPIAVVIAALNEEEALGEVIAEVPDTIAGLQTRVVLVDDGSTDATSDVADRAGALVCRLPRNCGHGVALRTGYRIAWENGARYIATLDADGQWDPADLPEMMSLLEADKADFVIGSRQLGRTENTDRLRNLGVRVFSRLISLLTRTRITDSSSGLRAMRVEVAREVRQTQPQYQTSELLIGAIFQGYRVAEVPTVMRLRRAGESKKGHNVLYGMRYARVILKTYLRERRGRKR